MSDPAYRAPVQHSNIHGSGEVRLGSQCGVEKALIGQIWIGYPQQKDMKRGVCKGSRKVLHMAHKGTRSNR